MRITNENDEYGETGFYSDIEEGPRSAEQEKEGDHLSGIIDEDTGIGSIQAKYTRRKAKSGSVNERIIRNIYETMEEGENEAFTALDTVDDRRTEQPNLTG